MNVPPSASDAPAFLFADRVHKHQYNGGALTDERVRQCYERVRTAIAPSIAGFNNTSGTQPNQPTVIGTRLYIRTATGGFNLGLSKNSSTGTDWVWDSRVWTNHQVLFLVGGYQFNPASTSDDVVSLWINPGSANFGAGSPPSPALTTASGNDISSLKIASFVFFQRDTTQPAVMLADELRQRNRPDRADCRPPMMRPSTDPRCRGGDQRTSRGAAPRTGNPVPETEVAEMFGRIAPAYDRLNTIMTAGQDGRWRRAAVDATGLGQGGSAIDVACGTGNLAAALAHRVGPFGRVVGVDPAPAMIRLARRRHGDDVQLQFAEGNAIALPYADGTFDAATIAFGLRNLSDFTAGLAEMRRVVRPGGRVVCLELTIPRPAWWGRLYLALFRRVAPAAATVVAPWA